MYLSSLVAVHGLDGHWEDTWTAENGVLWLRDCLPEEVPNVRIFTYGYDGRTHDTAPLSCQSLHDYALDLVTSLCLERKRTNVSIERALTRGNLLTSDLDSRTSDNIYCA